jgi:hypothetical protein
MIAQSRNNRTAPLASSAAKEFGCAWSGRSSGGTGTPYSLLARKSARLVTMIFR